MASAQKKSPIPDRDRGRKFVVPPLVPMLLAKQRSLRASTRMTLYRAYPSYPTEEIPVRAAAQGGIRHSLVCILTPTGYSLIDLNCPTLSRHSLICVSFNDSILQKITKNASPKINFFNSPVRLPAIHHGQSSLPHQSHDNCPHHREYRLSLFPH